MTPELRAALDEALPAPILEARSLGAGSINEAYELELSDGTLAFAKHQPDPPAAFFSTESAGLAWLAEPGVVDVPHVLGWRDETPAFLATEWIEHGDRTHLTEETLGRRLAALHRSGAPMWGWDREAYIGSAPQSNESAEDWPSFYGERRLLPMARRAVEAGELPADSLPGFETLAGKLAGLVPAETTEAGPSRLHGDLWAGNLVVGLDGSPWLVDPAPYGGDREVDLAMMRLFGGFGSATFTAYQDAWPLPDGHADRVALYQLYPLLVHVVLFGSSYASRALDALHRYV